MSLPPETERAGTYIVSIQLLSVLSIEPHALAVCLNADDASRCDAILVSSRQREPRADEASTYCWGAVTELEGLRANLDLYCCSLGSLLGLALWGGRVVEVCTER